MIDRGEVLFVEGKNSTRYAFRDGCRNEIWVEWHNDFEHVHPGSQWLVKLLVDARTELTGLRFAKARRYRNARIKGRAKPKTFEEAEGRIAFLEKQVSEFEKAEKARLKEEKKQKKNGKGSMVNNYMSLMAENARLKTDLIKKQPVRKDFQRILKENHKLRAELARMKLQEWLKGEEE